MLLFVTLAIAVALTTLAVIAWPIIAKESSVPVQDEEPDGAIAAIAAIERDRAAGLIDDAGAEAAIADTETAQQRKQRAPAEIDPRKLKLLRLAAIIALGLAPLAALHIYMKIGAPQAINPVAVAAVEAPVTADDQAAAIAAMPEDERRAMIASMVEGLAARLAAEPEDSDGWRMLARSYGVLGRHEESAAAWREALSRADGNAEDWRGLVVALLDQRSEGDNTVSEEAEAALGELRGFDPDDPLALFFLGHAARNRGDVETALKLWGRLRELLPPDAPIAPSIDQLIAETSG